MPFVAEKQEQWSKIGLRTCLGSVAAVVLLSLVDGILRGALAISLRDYTTTAMWATWVYDFRFMFENLMYVGAIVFVGAKFIETRSIFTVGFDKLDAEKVRLRGPDEDNVVWIGHRYGTRMEAETVASAIESRLKESAG